MIPETDIDTFAAAHRDGALVVDVREPSEYREGHVPGATLMPLATVPLRHAELPKGQPVYVICASGGRSAQATSLLQQVGVDARSVRGGTTAWVSAGRPVVVGTAAA